MAQKRIDKVINEIAYPSIERCIRVAVYTHTIPLCVVVVVMVAARVDTYLQSVAKVFAVTLLHYRHFITSS